MFVKSVLVLGSGPIVIGQGAEFDYSGTQACQVLKEAGIRVILLNPNPATVMTDASIADEIYFEALHPEVVKKIILKEQPQALLCSLGGQTALNLAFTLHEEGFLEAVGIKVLGTPLEAIAKSEDRQLFCALMDTLEEPMARSFSVFSIEEAKAILQTELHFPCVVRPAYTLGGTGGGVAHTMAELETIVSRGLAASLVQQVLLEESLLGWKEIEFEVVRDISDHCIVVCSMENFDPVGVHTGDSIVVAPCQTLPDPLYQRLRQSAFKIISALQIQGGCNIQFAVSNAGEYRIIEVNPRVSRSSALASKATGYPIARIATHLALGQRLLDLPNPMTQSTCAFFEPALDYCVVKVPCFAFLQFHLPEPTLSTQMQATGEVLGLGTTFMQALTTALQGVYPESLSDTRHWATLSTEVLLQAVTKHSPRRIWAIIEALKRGISVAEIAGLTSITPWFLHQLADFITNGAPAITDFRCIDSCAAEFEAATPYYYGTSQSGDALMRTCVSKSRILVLGSGPIKIGQGIEFDYSAVQALNALKRLGYEPIFVNNNPETVSTDVGVAHRLYFESFAIETLRAIYEREQPQGVMVCFAGQLGLNLARQLTEYQMPLLGLPLSTLEVMEDREAFRVFLSEQGIPHPKGQTVYSLEAALAVNEYPLFARPSYVIGGQGMGHIHSAQELVHFWDQYALEGKPVLLDRYCVGTEYDIDVIADGVDFVILGILEQIEPPGVHSGDSVAQYPCATLNREAKQRLYPIVQQLVHAAQLKGCFNLQMVWNAEGWWVLELNPRASRTLPYLAKVTGAPMVEWAVRTLLGESLASFYEGELNSIYPEPQHFVTLKIPVFSTHKIPGLSPELGPQMRSTGEMVIFAENWETAFAKAAFAQGKGGNVESLLLSQSQWWAYDTVRSEVPA